MSNTYNAFNKWKATKIYGSLEVKDYVVGGTVSDAGVLTCKDINSSTNITITSAILPTTENSNKVGTTAWVKSQNYLTSSSLTGYLTSASSINDSQLSSNVCLLTSTQTLTNKTLTTPIIASIKPTSLLTLTLPALTDTLVSRTSTDTLTNKTLTDCVANTQLTTDNSSKIATTAFVKSLGYISSVPATYALLNSPAFTGTPTAPTALSTDNSIQIATTAFVKSLGYLTSSSSITDSQLSSNVCLLDATQTLINKSLTTPIIASIKPTSLLTLTLPALTDTLVSRTSTDTLTNKTLTSPIISSILNTGTLTLPTSTDTLIGRNTTDTLTNKTLTDPKITNTLQFTNSTATQQLLLYQVNPTIPSYNYTISVEPNYMRYNITAGAVNHHLFSRGTGLNAYSDIALLDSLGITIVNGDLIFSNAGRIINTTGNTLTLPIATDTLVGKATTDTLTNKTLTSPTLNGTPIFSSAPSFNSGFNVLGGSIGSFTDVSNTKSTQISQYNSDCYIINYATGGSIYINASIANFVSSDAWFKGGTNTFGYGTHLPYSDGKNYITGQTFLRGGSVEIPDGTLYIRNGNGMNLYDTLTPASQCAIYAVGGNLNFDNYGDMLSGSGAEGNILFSTYNLNPTVPRFKVRLNLNYLGAQIKNGTLRVYSPDETSIVEVEQNSSNNTLITNYRNTGTMTLRTTNSSAVQVNNISMSSGNTTIGTLLTTSNNIRLPSSLIVKSANDLGYSIGGTINNVVGTVTLVSGTVYPLASIVLTAGTWNVFGQTSFNFGANSTLLYDMSSISSSSTAVSNDCLLSTTNSSGNTGYGMVRRINYITSVSTSTTLYLVILVGYTAGTPQYSNASQVYTYFNAYRIA